MAARKSAMDQRHIIEIENDHRRWGMEEDRHQD